MKKKVLLFTFMILLMLSLLPAFNLVSTVIGEGSVTSNKLKKYLKSATYNIDNVSKWLSWKLYQSGISIDPGQVIVGREGWLFLGDDYERTRTVTRSLQTQNDIDLGCRINSSLEEWNDWLLKKNVIAYRVVIAPNKSSIYPKFLPGWAQPAVPSPTDLLLECSKKNIYTDLRSYLLNTKVNIATPLYFRTDTHWNSLGAVYSFVAMMGSLQSGDSTLAAVNYKDIDYEIHTKVGGDLARILRFQDKIKEIRPVVTWLDLELYKTVQIDYSTRAIIAEGGNPTVSTPMKPLMVLSPSAINQRKLLWLRDSFGIALSPYIASSFTETIQIDWRAALANGGHLLIDLVNEWKPDFVILSLVERSFRNPIVSTRPLIPEE